MPVWAVLPMDIAVDAPPILIVVAVVFNKLKVVLPVVKLVVTAGEVRVLLVRVWIPVRVATVESIAIVTPVEPLYEVPESPVPIVRVLRLEPNEIPDIVLFDNFAFAIEPASIVLVTVPVSPVVTIVPVVAGIVRIVPVPTAAVGTNWTVPLVLPGNVIELIPVNAKFAEVRFNATDVVPI